MIQILKGKVMKKYVILGIILLSNFCFIGKIDAKDFVVPSADYSLSDQEVTGFPYSSVVYVSTNHPNRNGRGSGVVIGRDYVLTAAHVIDAWVPVDIIPGLRSNNTDPFGRWSGDIENLIYLVGLSAGTKQTLVQDTSIS